MLTKAYYTDRPDSILYMGLPSGEADVWLRKNIETAEGEEQGFTADEAYMRTKATSAEVSAEFERFFEEASAWRLAPEKEPRTQEERIEALEKAVKRLEEEQG